MNSESHFLEALLQYDVKAIVSSFQNNHAISQLAVAPSSGSRPQLS